MGHMKNFAIECGKAADDFRSLPFAFIEDEDARRMSDEIRNGEVRRAMDALRDDMHTHYECGNIIKRDREDAVYRQLVRIAMKGGAA